jgi:Fe-Mn family superoxide dismutase
VISFRAARAPRARAAHHFLVFFSDASLAKIQSATMNLPITRREMLRTACAATAFVGVAPRHIRLQAAEPAPCELPKLSYAFDALEPAIDAATMRLHYEKHHKAYIDNLNKALSDRPDLRSLPIAELVRGLVPGKSPPALVNHGGGHLNHAMFWESLRAPRAENRPEEELSEVIARTFKTFDAFREQFTKTALGHFGSGWAWLALDERQKLIIRDTLNQESPLMFAQQPLLGLDVWEHAYYLKYQNRRADYIAAWWSIVNWEAVAERFEKASTK